MTKAPFPSDHQDKFMLRLPDGMRDRIKAVAEANNRSMNSEIVATLEEKYPPVTEAPNVMLIMHQVSKMIMEASDADLPQVIEEAQALLDTTGEKIAVRYEDRAVAFLIP